VIFPLVPCLCYRALGVAVLVVGLSAGGCSALLSSPGSGSKVRVQVPKAPPPARAEKPPSALRPGHFWVRGYWDWVPRAGVFMWRAGHYKKARANRRYVPAMYTRNNGGWIYRIPHWRRVKVRRAHPSPRHHPASSLFGTRR